MKTSHKLLAGGLITLFFVAPCGGVAVFFGYMARANAYVQAHRAAAEEEGRELGAGGDAEACVGAALAKADDDNSLGEDEIQVRFLMACLDSAAPPPAFCAGVPKGTISTLAVAQWVSSACARRGHPGSSSCSSILEAIPRHCAPAQR